MRVYFIFFLLLMSACASRGGMPAPKNKKPHPAPVSTVPKRYHTVVEGDTIEKISEKYDVSWIELMLANRIRDSKVLTPGLVLFIPYDVGRLRGYEDDEGVGAGPDLRPTSREPVLPMPEMLRFDFPLAEVKVNSFFGWRRGKLHEGVDFQARKGTAVYAAAAGDVLYVGRKIKGFGKLIILDHGNDWFSLYGHLSQTFVKVGQHLSSGRKIALSGATGKVRGAHLHFEIRKGADTLDPLLYLPEIK